MLRERHFQCCHSLVVSFLGCGSIGTACADQIATPSATQTLLAAERLVREHVVNTIDGSPVKQCTYSHKGKKVATLIPLSQNCPPVFPQRQR